MLGPQAGFLSMAIILTLQCLLFADGGLMALGANIWNMTFYGCFVGYYLIWRPIMKGRLFGDASHPGAARSKIVLASVLGSVLTLQMGAFSVVLETTLSGVSGLSFGAFCSLMQPIHLAIGLVEGVITAAVLLFAYEARPELLQEVPASVKARKGLSLKTTLALLAVLCVIVAGGLSLVASTNPDGLEWALFGNAEAGYGANMALDEAHYGVTSAVADAADAIVEKTALLPDYAFSGSDSMLGTAVSGLLGAGLVAAIAAGVCYVGGFFRKKEKVHA